MSKEIFSWTSLNYSGQQNFFKYSVPFYCTLLSNYQVFYILLQRVENVTLIKAIQYRYL